MDEPNVTPRIKFRYNWRALSGLLALAVAAAVGAVTLAAFQERRVRGDALAVVRGLHDRGEVDLALRHLNRYLQTHPPDVEALTLKARLMDRGANPSAMLDTARAYEQLVRFDPNGPEGLKARRRLVELYVAYGDRLKASSLYEKLPDLAALDSRYLAASRNARQLIAARPGDPSAHRLLATALDGLAVPGDTRALNEAVREYRAALQGDPADAEAADRLANLYLGRMNDPARAERVLDDLLRARPRSVDTRLARHRFFLTLRRDAKAAAELEAANALAPDDPSVLLAGAQDALRRGDTEDARGWLARVPESPRDDPRVMMVRGLVEFGEERPDEAVDIWRKGLMTSAGTDTGLTWWLAYVLLQLDRVEEARPLLNQYRRLAGDEAPLFRLLVAVMDERSGMPARAARGLELMPAGLDARWQVMTLTALGRSYEALYDDPRAIEAYHRAVKVDPTAIVPRLSAARLRMKVRPDDAAEEIRRGLRAVPGDPALRVALAGALLRVEAMKPRARRSFDAFDRAFRDAAAAPPGGTAAALMAADRLSLEGKDEESLRSLEGSAARAPRAAAVATALADALARRGRQADALAALERASAPDAAGGLASLRVARARLLVAMNRGREARAGLVRDLSAMPTAGRIRVWSAAGAIEAARGDQAAARRAYDEWARLAPLDPRPRLLALDAALARGDEAEIRAAVEAIKATVGEDEVSYRLALARQLLWERDAAAPPPGNRDASLERAGKLVDAALAEAPELPPAQTLRAEVLERKGLVDEAIAAYERVWQRGDGAALPRLVGLLARRRRFDALARLRAAAPGASTQVDLLSAQAFLRAGDAAQATQIAGRVAADLPDDPEALGWQARMLNLLGRFDDAETALRATADRRPGEAEPWLALIRFQAGRGRAQAASESVARAKAAVATDRPDLLDARCAWAAGDRDAADRAFAGALAATPADPSVLGPAARYYEETGRPALAEAALRRALDADPKDRPAARQLATSLSSRAGTPDAWQAAWDVLGPEAPGSEAPEDRLARAVVLSRCPDRARRAGAVPSLDALLADLAPDNPTAVATRDYLVRLLLETGYAERAGQVASVSAAPGGDPGAIALYAEALIRGKKPDAAGWQIDRLAAINPGDRREASLRTRLAWDPDRPVEAAAALERAYTSREGTAGAELLGREVFAVLADLPGPDPSRVAERVGRRVARDNPSASWMPAAVLARRGRVDDAFGLLQAALRPGSPEDLRETGRVAMNLAVAHGDAETLRKAAAVLVAARAIDPHSDELLVMLAMLRHLQGAYEDEVDAYRAVLARRPADYVATNNLAWALCEGVGRPGEALELVDGLVKSVGQDAEALDTRGVILTRLGRHGEAVGVLERVVTLAPTGLHHFHLARAYRLAGRPDDARTSRDRAREAGLTLEGVDATERADLKALLEM